MEAPNGLSHSKQHEHQAVKRQANEYTENREEVQQQRQLEAARTAA